MPTELSLDFRKKQLTEFPAEIRLQPDVTHLNLSGNRISAIPEWIGELKNLEVLYMNDNALTDISPLTAVSTLVVLELNKNKITRLPEGIINWKKLRRLKVSDNMLQFIPETIGGLEELERLSLGNNLLLVLPDSIAMLDKLEMMLVSDNRLQHLPLSIGALKTLKYLGASFNQLESLPDVFKESQALQKLYVYKNRIKTLPPSLLQLKSLLELNIGCNAIDRLANLPEQIQRLSIYDNPLKETTPETIGLMINKFREKFLKTEDAYFFLDTTQLPSEIAAKEIEMRELTDENGLKLIDIEKRYATLFDLFSLPLELITLWNISQEQIREHYNNSPAGKGKTQQSPSS